MGLFGQVTPRHCILLEAVDFLVHPRFPVGEHIGWFFDMQFSTHLLMKSITALAYSFRSLQGQVAVGPEFKPWFQMSLWVPREAGRFALGLQIQRRQYSDLDIHSIFRP
eukprot:g40232.t1